MFAGTGHRAIARRAALNDKDKASRMSKTILGISALDRKSTRLNSSHANISYAVFCLKKKKNIRTIGTLSYVLREGESRGDTRYRTQSSTCSSASRANMVFLGNAHVDCPS